MKYIFKSKIYKTGINWCVDVPYKITDKLVAQKGRFNIKGQINGFDFTKTLVPVKNNRYRLFVNQAMMKGGKTSLGQIAVFEVEEDREKVSKEYPIPKALSDQLKHHELIKEFECLTASRKKDILKYLNYIKREETLLKNMKKLIIQLSNKEKNVRIP